MEINLTWVVVAIVAIYFLAKRFKKWRSHHAGTGGGSHSPPPAHGSGHSHQSGLGWIWGTIIAIMLLAIIVAGVTIWMSDPNQQQTSQKKFTHVYFYEEDNVPSGPVSVTLTPNSIELGFPAAEGGNINMRWTRQGGGVWTRRFNRKSYGSWFRIKNMTDDPEADFKAWQTEIVGTIGDDTDPTKSYSVSLRR